MIELQGSLHVPGLGRQRRHPAPDRLWSSRGLADLLALTCVFSWLLLPLSFFPSLASYEVMGPEPSWTRYPILTYVLS